MTARSKKVYAPAPPPTATPGPMLSVRLTAGTDARLAALAAKYPLTKHGIARIALERGLDAIDADPKWFEKAGKAR